MHKHINRPGLPFLLSSLLFLVAACGGGGGSSPINGGGGTGSAATEVTSLALADSNGARVSAVRAGTPTTLSFTLVDSSGDAVPNATGTFDLGVPVAGSDARKSVANGSFTASGSGVASITLLMTDPTVAGTGVLSISLGDTTVTQNITVVQIAGVPVSFSIRLIQDAADSHARVTAISAANPGIIVADLVDFNGSPVTGEIINVGSTLGDLTPGSGSVLTNSAGRATAGIEVGSADPGDAGVITVSVTNLDSQTINFAVVAADTAGSVLSSALYNLDVNLAMADPAADPGVAAGEPGSDPELANRRTTVNAVENGIYVVQVKDASGDFLEGVIVMVSTDVGELTPGNGRILTDARGIASAIVSAGTADPGAAGILTAILEDLEDVSDSINVSIGSITLALGFDKNLDGLVADTADTNEINLIGIGAPGVTDGSTVLSATGSTVLSVTVIDATGAPFTTPLTVNFSSPCSISGDAMIDTGVTTVDGTAMATYTAAGCEGRDTITARVVELGGVTASGVLEVADADANSIRFISADPESITLRGTGGTGRQEFSTLIFRVIDEAGNPISGQRVSVSLSTALGGVSLTGDASGNGLIDDEALTSNASGEVNVVVNAGTVPTSVRVEASIVVSGAVIKTVSDNLVVSTGLPDNNSFSMSASILSPGGFDVDGVTSELSIRAADAFNNPVPDGTTINFTTEYGRIGDTCTTTLDGNCSVAWNSQAPRQPGLASTGKVLTIVNQPCDSNQNGIADLDAIGALNTSLNLGLGPDAALARVSTGVPCPRLTDDNSNLRKLTGDSRVSVLVDEANKTFPGQIFGGRSTILAYAIGEESFIDANSNGIYDWIDTNDDSEYDATESLEAFVDLSEAFVDHNEDAVFGNDLTPGGCTAIGVGSSIQPVVDVNDLNENGNTTEMIGAAVLCADWQVGGAEETFIDFNFNGIFDRGNGIYNGTLCSPTLEALTPPLCTSQLVSVRDQQTLIVGGSFPRFGVYAFDDTVGRYLRLVSPDDDDLDVTINTDLPEQLTAAGLNRLVTTADVTADSSVTRRVIISDRFNARLPAGTRVEVSSTNCKIDSPTEFTIQNSNDFGNYVVDVRLSEDTNMNGVKFGFVVVDVELPASAGGRTAMLRFVCLDRD